MNISHAVQSRTVAALSLVLGLGIAAAEATEGYFQHGYGARHKAIGGAGVADSRDATAAALNPAGLTGISDQFNGALSVFSPRREMNGTPTGPFPGFTPTGEVDSEWNFFAVPNIAVSYQLHDNSIADVIAFTVYGNGGMNTHYPEGLRPDGGCFNPMFGVPIGTQLGVFCFGQMGVNLEQAFISLAAAKQFGSVSVGVAPIIATQVIELDGLHAFGAASIDPANVTNRGQDRTWGVGVRAGVEVEVSEGMRLGIAGNSRIYMSEFDKYKGLFAEGGDFDIPPSLQAGIAVDLTPQLTFMLDYKRIWYSEIASINNPSTNIFNCLPGPAGGTGPGCLGAANGAGFGWEDINIVKAGLEYRPGERTAYRVGYAYNENPISSRDVMFNIIAPGVVQHHFTAGAQMPIAANWDLELAGFYAPHETVDGFELAGFGNPTHGVEIGMHQYEVTFGLTYHFDQPADPFK